MKLTLLKPLLCALLLAPLSILAAEAPAEDEVGQAAEAALLETMRTRLEVGELGLRVESVAPSAIEGLYEVQFANGGPLVYASKSGEHFIVGDLFSAGPGGYVNLTEKRRDKERLAQLAGVSTDDMIVFPAEGEARAHVTVFTDVTCFYCQKLHKEVPELNRRGVEVRYLAYPRGGMGSDGYRKLASAWCADNPQDILTRLKNKQSVDEQVCPGNPVASQYSLGQAMGVRGTPAIVTDSGQMIPGYQDANQLIQTLGLN